MRRRSVARRALDQFRRLEASRDGPTWPAPRRARARRARDAVMSGVVLDLREETDLAAGDAERVDLSPKLACEAQQHRPKPVGCSDGIVNHANH